MKNLPSEDRHARGKAPPPPRQMLVPAFASTDHLTASNIRGRFIEATDAWLCRSPSMSTRENYARDLAQFMGFLGIHPDAIEQLANVRPEQIATWRDHLTKQGLANSSVCRKMTALRSFYSYLQTYGYTGPNPAHSDFVQAPAVARDGKTVGLSPENCRRILDAPDPATPTGIRDRAIFAVLAYSACRVGELVLLRVKDYRTHSGHHILDVLGKGGKERRVALHPEAFDRIERWLDVAGIGDDPQGALFRPQVTARGDGRDGFRAKPMTRRAVQKLVERTVIALGLDPAVTVHSFRVTALTTARELGNDIIDLQDFAGHADPRTTLSYIRNRDRLAKSPAHSLRY